MAKTILWVVGGFKISKGKLRGVESNGMLCSEEEIGININGEKSTGIMILDGEPQLGADFVEYYGLKEALFVQLDLIRKFSLSKILECF